MLKKSLPFLAFLLIAFFLIVESSHALRITLKRIVFEGSKRAEVMTIINNTDKPETYRLGWRHYRMTSNKSLVDIPEGEALPPEIKPSADMVRFAPRRFTIPPNSSQQIRLMMRMPADLPDGEYRSHLWIRPEAEVKQLRAERTPSDSKRSGVSVKMLAGITTPVIIRKGNLQATASIDLRSAAIIEGKIVTQFSLTREGNKSIYGDLRFSCNPGSSSQYDLRSSRGVAVYTELNTRNFTIKIPQDTEKGACNTLGVSFYQTEGYEADEGVLLAESQIQIN